MHRIAFAIAAIFSVSIASPVLADGEIVITQAKALAGNVTPGDAAGFPVTLSQPGAYILGSNLTVPGYTYGMIVTSHNVDIDLKGFRLAGNNFGTYGVVSNYGESRIHGGVINTFRNAGIYIRNNAWTIEDMQIVRNGGSGIDATGSRYITVRKSLVAANAFDGIVSGRNLSVYDSTVSQNRNSGISCTDGCHVHDSVVDENSADGIVLRNGFVSGNTIFNNGGYGVFDQTGAKDTGMADNMLVNNNSSGSSQTTFTVDVHPNTCVGKPCNTP